MATAGPSRPIDILFLDRRRIARSAASPTRRKGPRSKEEIERERRERWEKTVREVDELYAEYAAKAVLRPGQSQGVVYCRFSTRFQDSIADQVRKILQHALQIDVFVKREHILFDLAVRGFKKRRSGLDQVERLLRGKEANTLLLFATNRLFRKQYLTLRFVDEIHRGLDVRCIFVKSGVDTNDKQRWESILALQSMVDQFVVSMYVANVQAAHEGLLNRRFVFGTLSFGYTGVPIEGLFTIRKLPRREIVVDEETAAFVRQIFEWFVKDRVSIAEIICRLNSDPDIPLPPHARSGMWTRTAVRNVLVNTRYRGLWCYGVTESVYIPDGDYVRKKMRAEPLAEIHFEQLRIVSNETWFAAQALLEKEASRGGRPPKDGDHQSRPKILKGMPHCGEHHKPEEIDQVWRLHQQGLLGKEIGATMKCSRAKVSNLLRAAHEKFGVPYVDGRKRRATLLKKQVEPPLYERIADEVMRLYNLGCYEDDIASKLGVSANLVTKAIRHSHEKRGLPVPDGRARAATLPRRPEKQDDQPSRDRVA